MATRRTAVERKVGGKTYRQAQRGARAGRWYEVQEGAPPRWVSRADEERLGLSTATPTRASASAQRSEVVKAEVRPRVSVVDGERRKTSTLPARVRRAAEVAREECGDACKGLPITMYYRRRRRS